MAQSIGQDAQDAFLNEIATATTQVLCSAEPANFAGIAGVTLASVAMSGGDFSISGAGTRVLTVEAKSGITASASDAGASLHLVLHDGASILAITTAPTQAIASGGDLTIASWTVSIPQP